MTNFDSLIQKAKATLIKAENLSKSEAARLLKATHSEVSFECFQLDMVAPEGQTLRSTENVFIAYRKWLEDTIKIVGSASEQGITNNTVVILFRTFELADESILEPEAGDWLERCQKLAKSLDGKLPYWLCEVFMEYYKALAGKHGMIESGYKPCMWSPKIIDTEEEELLNKYDDFDNKVSELNSIGYRITNYIHGQGHNQFTFEDKNLSTFNVDPETEIPLSSIGRTNGSDKSKVAVDGQSKDSLRLGKIAFVVAFFFLVIIVSVKPSTTNKMYSVVEAKSLRVRSEPSAKSQVINQLSLGEHVQVKETTNGWSFVVSKDVSGWVSSKYLSSSE